MNKEGDIKTDEEKIEEDLASRKPLKLIDDKEQVDETDSSIKWAEKNLKSKLALPKKDPV